MPDRASRLTAVAVLVAAAVLGFSGGAMLGQQLGTGAEPEVTATAQPDAEPTPEPGITLEADATSAAANQDVRLAGALVPAVGGIDLQVERSLDGGEWQEFPVTTTSQDDGSFGVTVRTGRAGENRFRVVGEVEGEPMASNEVPVTIG